VSDSERAARALLFAHHPMLNCWWSTYASWSWYDHLIPITMIFLT
jgi:hypothetical protein